MKNYIINAGSILLLILMTNVSFAIPNEHKVNGIDTGWSYPLDNICDDHGSCKTPIENISFGFMSYRYWCGTDGLCNKYHYAQDLTTGYKENDPVYAMADGFIVRIRKTGSYGASTGQPCDSEYNTMLVEYNYIATDGKTKQVYVFYGHVKNIINPDNLTLVKKEETVKIRVLKNNKIAELNNPRPLTGCADSGPPHLHLSVLPESFKDQKACTDNGVYDRYCPYYAGYNKEQIKNGRARPFNSSKDGDTFDEVFFDSYTSVNTSTTSTNIDVAIIIDTSGSMRENDPTYKRKEAARAFIDNAKDDDQIAIIDFDFDVNVLWRIQNLTSNRDDIKNAVEAIDNVGGTDIGLGLKAAYNELESSSQPNKKAAVLLTDGKDIYNYYNNEASLYKDKGWPIYTIGLGDDTDPDLLQDIADTSGGKYFPLTDSSQLENVYFEISAVTGGGRLTDRVTTRLEKGAFWDTLIDIPQSQETISFFSNWQGSEVNMTLLTPGGFEITPSTEDTDIYHAKGLTYEIYRIGKNSFVNSY